MESAAPQGGRDAAGGRQALHVLFVADGSGSMTGERIGSLNWAAMTVVPAMRMIAAEHPDVEVLVRVCRFGDDVSWPVAMPTPVADFVWPNLAAGGESAMGAALLEVAAALSELDGDAERRLPPVVILLSDGLPSDDAAAGIAALDAGETGRLAVRIAIAIGQDADLETLRLFIGPSGLRPLAATNADTLVRWMRWAATVPVAAASGSPGTHPTVPPPPDPPDEGEAGKDVW